MSENKSENSNQGTTSGKTADREKDNNTREDGANPKPNDSQNKKYDFYSSLTYKPRRKVRHVLTRMENELRDGPFNILYRSVDENLQVRVFTRSFNHVRGICTGYVMAYDKHWNLAMYDVDEVYRNPLALYPTKPKPKKTKPNRRKPKDNSSNGLIDPDDIKREKDIPDTEYISADHPMVKSFFEGEDDVEVLKFQNSRVKPKIKTEPGTSGKSISGESSKQMRGSNQSSMYATSRSRTRENSQSSDDECFIVEKCIKEEPVDLVPRERGALNYEQENIVKTETYSDNDEIEMGRIGEMHQPDDNRLDLNEMETVEDDNKDDLQDRLRELRNVGSDDDDGSDDHSVSKGSSGDDYEQRWPVNTDMKNLNIKEEFQSCEQLNKEAEQQDQDNESEQELESGELTESDSEENESPALPIVIKKEKFDSSDIVALEETNKKPTKPFDLREKLLLKRQERHNSSDRDNSRRSSIDQQKLHPLKIKTEESESSRRSSSSRRHKSSHRRERSVSKERHRKHKKDGKKSYRDRTRSSHRDSRKHSSRRHTSYSSESYSSRSRSSSRTCSKARKQRSRSTSRTRPKARKPKSRSTSRTRSKAQKPRSRSTSRTRSKAQKPRSRSTSRTRSKAQKHREETTADDNRFRTIFSYSYVSEKEKSPDVLKRHVNQLFIRGDNVVMVSLVQD